jgi:hypothetical protein
MVDPHDLPVPGECGAAACAYAGSIFAKLPLDPDGDRRVSAVLAYLRN